MGKEHLVLDLSCRYRSEPGKDRGYYIVTDRWQKYTDEMVTPDLLDELSAYCVEFLIHAVDVAAYLKTSRVCMKSFHRLRLRRFIKFALLRIQ